MKSLLTIADFWSNLCFTFVLYKCPLYMVDTMLIHKHIDITLDAQKSAIWFGLVENGKYWIEIYISSTINISGTGKIQSPLSFSTKWPVRSTNMCLTLLYNISIWSTEDQIFQTCDHLKRETGIYLSFNYYLIFSQSLFCVDTANVDILTIFYF